MASWSWMMMMTMMIYLEGGRRGPSELRGATKTSLPYRYSARVSTRAIYCYTSLLLVMVWYPIQSILLCYIITYYRYMKISEQARRSSELRPNPDIWAQGFRGLLECNEIEKNEEKIRNETENCSLVGVLSNHLIYICVTNFLFVFRIINT
jgi:hypothetical protein